MIDPFGRSITYLRVSVTDRCDLRCVYCMAEHMTFLPKAEVLTLEELDRRAPPSCASAQQDPPDRRRAPGPEGRHEPDRGPPRHSSGGGLNEMTLTTNGTRVAARAALAAAGVRRINVSLDTLDPEKFRRHHPLGRSREGAGRHRRRASAGLAVKINAVALKDVNDDEFAALIAWAASAASTSP